MSHIFIGGSGRCGTSVLGLAFTKHPDVVYLAETRVFRYLLPVLRGEITLGRFQARMEITRRILHDRGYLPALGAQDVYTKKLLRELMLKFSAELQTSGLDAARNFVDDFFGAPAKKAKRKYWVEKTPHTCRFANELYRLFPDMRYVHIIREPKDVCASIVAASWGPDNVPDAATDFYARVMTGAWIVRQEIPAENYTVVSLEALVERPEKVLGHILRFAGIPASGRVLTRMARVVSPTLAHLGRWREDLSPEDVALVHAKCGPLYARWKGVEAKYV